MDSILYLAAACLFAASAAGFSLGPAGRVPAWLANPATAGCIVLCIALYAGRADAAANFHVGIALAAFALAACVLLLASDPGRRFRHSWQLMPALAAVGSAAAVLPLPGHELADASAAFALHAAPAAVSYAFFLIAISQLIDVRAASRRVADADHSGQQMPLLKMEARAFGSVYIAFSILTLTLASGLLLSAREEGPLLEFNHKNIFAFLTWVCSLVLVAGRLARGWRGTTALRWLGIAVLFLVLSYLGTVFAYDIILGKANPAP